MLVLIFINGLEKYQNQKLVELLVNTNTWGHTTHWTNNDPKTGEVLEWKVKPYNKVDEIAAYHDICYDMGNDKGDCDKKMVKSLDTIPYGKMPKWGQTARLLIDKKQKLGLSVKSKNVKSRRVKKTDKKN